MDTALKPILAWADLSQKHIGNTDSHWAQMQLHGAASQKKYTATVAGEAEQTRPRMPGLNQQLQNSYCYPGSSSTPSSWAFKIFFQFLQFFKIQFFFFIGYLFLPWVKPVGLLLHTGLHLFTHYHTKTQECLTSLLEMGSICLRTETYAQLLLSSTLSNTSHCCSVCDIQFGLVLK